MTTNVTEEIKPTVVITREIPGEGFSDLQNGDIEKIFTTHNLMTDEELIELRLQETLKIRESKDESVIPTDLT